MSCYLVEAADQIRPRATLQRHASQPQGLETHAHTSRAALRPGTAAIVKMSAGLDVFVVRPFGSVVSAGLASLKHARKSCPRAQWPLVASAVLQIRAVLEVHVAVVAADSTSKVRHTAVRSG